MGVPPLGSEANGQDAHSLTRRDARAKPEEPPRITSSHTQNKPRLKSFGTARVRRLYFFL